MKDEMPPAMALAISAGFGSLAQWRDQFAAMSQPACATVRLCFDAQRGRPVNAREGEPHGTVLHVGAAAALDDIDWAAVYARYQQAVHDASEPLAVQADALQSALVLDVRRAGVFEQADTMIPGAAWRDPSQVEAWGAELPSDRDVIVYCVYGHEVGRSTAMQLRARGVNARFLEGGIAGWQSAGRPLQRKVNPATASG